jgi:putative ABC transport system permease protein
MTSLIRLAIRNALRNGRRTMLTAGTVAIGTAFTVLSLSFIGGMFNGMISEWTNANGAVRVVTAAFAEEEQLAPIYENIPDAAPLVAMLEGLPGVAQAAPMIRTGVLVTLGEELGEDPALLTGSSPAWYAERLLPGSTMSSGRWLSDGASDEEIVLGSKIARDLGAVVGDEILVMGTTQYGSMSPISADIVGIISGNSAIDAQAFVSLEVARWMVDVPAGAIEVLVYPAEDSEAAVAAVTEAASAALGADYVVTPWYVRDIWAQSKPILDGMQLVISLSVVFIMALAIFNTMTMSVLERTGEIGVMRAMGQTRESAVLFFLAESTIIGLIGGIAGAAIGAIPALYLERNGLRFSQDILDEMGAEYAMSSTLSGDLTPDIIVLALVIGVVTAALGAFFPSLRAARIAPYEAMRAQR